MPENHTIPDPHLTREEAQGLLELVASECEQPHALAIFDQLNDKLRNSLSAPLVEDGGEDEAVEILAERLYSQVQKVGDPGWDVLLIVDPQGQAAESWRRAAREHLAAIQPFLGQEEKEAAERKLADARCVLEAIAENADDPSAQSEADACLARISLTQQHKEEEKV